MSRIGYDPIGENFFIILVDGIFTVSVEQAFTNVFDAAARADAAPCLCLRRNAD